MASPPKNFLHTKTLPDGTVINFEEEGSDGFTLEHSCEFQKYIGKNEAYPYKGYLHKVDMQVDPFLASLGKAKKEKYDRMLHEVWKQRGRMYKFENVKYEEWYMVVENRKNEPSTVAIFQDYWAMKDVRDRDYIPDVSWSLKAVRFESLKSAKNYVQMCRDEEGRHFGWPNPIPIVWNVGPITNDDYEENPLFWDYYMVDQEEGAE